MYRFVIQSNRYLSRDVPAFYHTNYVGYKKPGNPDYINTLKNTYNSYSKSMLDDAVQGLRRVLLDDLPQILRLTPLTVCVVPRAKTNPIAVIYDHLTDEDNPKYDLNRQLIKEQKGKITIINRNNLDSIIEKKLPEKPSDRNSQPIQTSLFD